MLLRKFSTTQQFLFILLKLCSTSCNQALTQYYKLNIGDIHLQAVIPANISANLGSLSWEKIASGFSTDFPPSWTLADILGTGTCGDTQRKVIPSTVFDKKEFRDSHYVLLVLLKSAVVLHLKWSEAQKRKIWEISPEISHRMTAHLFDVLQVLLAVAEVVCKGDKMTFLQKTIKIQKGIVMVSYFTLPVKHVSDDLPNPFLWDPSVFTAFYIEKTCTTGMQQGTGRILLGYHRRVSNGGWNTISL